MDLLPGFGLREDRLGAVCRYKVGGAAETEIDVFVPNETLRRAIFVGVALGCFLDLGLEAIATVI
jgi:hypothetical protein